MLREQRMMDRGNRDNNPLYICISIWNYKLKWKKINATRSSSSKTPQQHSLGYLQGVSTPIHLAVHTSLGSDNNATLYYVVFFVCTIFVSATAPTSLLPNTPPFNHTARHMEMTAYIEDRDRLLLVSILCWHYRAGVGKKRNCLFYHVDRHNNYTLLFALKLAQYKLGEWSYAAIDVLMSVECFVSHTPKATYRWMTSIDWRSEHSVFFFWANNYVRVNDHKVGLFFKFAKGVILLKFDNGLSQ